MNGVTSMPAEGMATVAENTSFRNSTTQGSGPLLLDSKLWVTFAVLETFMLFGALYVLAALVFYMIRRRRRFLGLPKASKRRIMEGTLLMFVTAYTVTCAAKYILAQVVLYSPPIANLCSSFAKANRLLVIVGFGLLTTFLWLRQHVLYALPQVRHLTSPFIKWWSRLTLLFIVIAFVTGIVIIGMKQWSHDDMCVTEDAGVSASALAGLIAEVIVQGFLLSLFCILIVKRWMKAGDIPTGSHGTRRLVTKCCVLAAICALTDITAFVIVTLIKGFVPEMVTILILDIDQFINLCCLLLCFSTWRKMLLPWPCCESCDLGKSAPNTTNSDAVPVQDVTLSQLSAQASSNA